MRSTTRGAVALALLCLIGVACRPKAPVTPTAVTVQPALPPPTAAGPTAAPAVPAAPEQPPTLNRQDLRALLSQGDEAQKRAALARAGIKYFAHPSSSTLTTLAPVTRVALAAAVDDMIDACPQFFGEDLRNAWHDFNGELYFIDEAGRPAQAYSELPPIAAEVRSNACQGAVGKWGDDEPDNGDYDGGHMIGSQLGGWGKRLNMVPQLANFNRGSWVQLENRAADCGRLAPGRLIYWVEVTYPDAGALVPDTMKLYLEDTQDHDFIELTFQNAFRGGPNGIAERKRGINFLKQLGCP